MDDPLGLVRHIARALQLSDHITAYRQLGQVDGAIPPSGQFHRAVVSFHLLKSEPYIGDHFGQVGRIYFNEMDARESVIDINKLPDAISRFQLHLLGRGVQDVAIVSRIRLLGPVSAGFTVSKKDLSHSVRLELAERFTVSPNFKGDPAIR